MAHTLSALATVEQSSAGRMQELVLLGLLCLLVPMILLSVRKQIKSRVNAHLSVVRKQETQMLEVTTAIARELQLQPLIHVLLEIGPSRGRHGEERRGGRERGHALRRARSPPRGRPALRR